MNLWVIIHLTGAGVDYACVTLDSVFQEVAGPLSVVEDDTDRELGEVRGRRAGGEMIDFVNVGRLFVSRICASRNVK
jgi:hypothetical protein